ncbi:MAG: DNA mismatch endonuclease Vsr [Tissierellales bacterium]|nr:DNA mismatch endonuclease Vsr [Tissierellales bacterium]
MDRISKKHRSWNMSRIRSKNTKPEIIVRSILHRNGYRFRLHKKDLPGKPDIVLPKFNTVVFVHGCFWHRHENCSDATTPKTSTDFWQKKFEDNVKRDKRNIKALQEAGWKVIIIWECEIGNPTNVLQKIEECIKKK